MTLEEMTLNGLIKQARLLMMQVSSGDIPLTKDIELSFTKKDGEIVVKVEEKGDRVTTAQQAAKEYSDRMRTEMKGQSNGIALYEAFLAGWAAAMKAINTY